MAEEFGGEDDEFFSEDDESDGGNKENFGASTSWNNAHERESSKAAFSAPQIPSSANRFPQSSRSTTLSSSPVFLGKETPVDDSHSVGARSNGFSSKLTVGSSLYTPSTVTANPSSSTSENSERVAHSAEFQASRPSLPEPAKSGIYVDNNNHKSVSSRNSQHKKSDNASISGTKRDKASESSLVKAPVKSLAHELLRSAEMPVSREVSKPGGREEKLLLINGKWYAVLNTIGKGGSSLVFEALDKEESRVVAVKRVDLEGADEDVKKAFLNEIKLLNMLKDTNRVVSLLDHEHKPEENVLFVVMEKGETDFSTHLKKRRKEPKFENLIAAYWQEMLLAVQVIHNQGIVHSDLKPSNFLLVGGTFKLIDFGIARSVPKDVTSVTMNCQMGTLNYMSPEAMNNISGGSGNFKYKVPLKSDVWSLGCILYSMVYGRTPFQRITNVYSKMVAIMGGNPGRPHQIDYPETDERGNPVDQEVLDVIKSCLRRNWKNRPSVDKLLDDPYLKNTKTTAKGKEGASLVPDPHAIWQNSPRTNDRLLKLLVAENLDQRRLFDHHK